MARCSHCGTMNREGSAFCQGCGQRLEEPKAKPSAGPTCGSCGTVNAAGMNFCKMCGSSLTAVAAAPADAAAAQRVTCVACNKLTPAGFAFCQHCGHRVGATAPQPVVAAPSDGKAAVAATMMGEAPVLVTPPAGMPRPASGARAVTGTASTQPGAGTVQPSASAAAPNDAFAATLGPGSAPLLAAVVAAGAASRGTGGNMSTVKTAPVRPEPIVEEKVYATLVVVRRDGSDGETVRITAPQFDIGRNEGGLTFADDVYLARRHLRLTFEQGVAKVRSLDTVNGVYLRLRGATDLHPGDVFLVGKEVVRYEPVPVDERETTLQEHGVRLFGSVPREPWGRLRQITAVGTSRDVWHLSRPDLVLGREEGDVTFPDDEFMSRRHAAVRRATPHPKLEDLNSSNGTFIRLRAEHVLDAGDLLRLGDQLLRVEL